MPLPPSTLQCCGDPTTATSRQELARLQQQRSPTSCKNRPANSKPNDPSASSSIAIDKQAERSPAPLRPKASAAVVARRLLPSFSANARPASPPWVASPSRPVARRTPALEVLDQQAGHTSARPPGWTKSSLAPSRCSWSSNPRASVGSAVACPPAAMAPPGPANSGNYPLWSR